MHTINIIENQTINPIFVRATSELLIRFSKDFEAISSTNLKKEKLKQLWKTVYFVIIVEENEVWRTMQFENIHDKTMFLLKYSTL
jgi:hypothetical protein